MDDPNKNRTNAAADVPLSDRPSQDGADGVEPTPIDLVVTQKLDRRTIFSSDLAVTQKLDRGTVFSSDLAVTQKLDRGAISPQESSSGWRAIQPTGYSLARQIGGLRSGHAAVIAQWSTAIGKRSQYVNRTSSQRKAAKREHG